MMNHARILIHDPSYEHLDVSGKKPHEIQRGVDSLNKVCQTLAEIISERTGKSLDEIYKITAERKGYTVIGNYIDSAISGKNAENRPQFMQMISDSARREFDCIIVWKIDRFSRDKYDSTAYKFKLKQNGVSLISATEPIDNTPEGKLMESIFEGFSEYYISDLGEKVDRGMTENAIKGKFNGGAVTFSYSIDANKHFVIDPEAAAIVTDIFIRYANGEPIRSIVDELNGKGIKNNGKPFTYHFVNWLLKNRRYLGEYKYKDTVNTTAIPPLVTAEVFEKCQQRLEANKHKSASFKKVEEKYYLTGKIFCGCCGDTMSGISGTGKNAIYRYYQCMTSKKKRCGKKIVQKDFVKNTVMLLIMEIIKDKELVKRICDTCFSLQSKKSSLLPTLKKQQRQIKKEIDNVMRAVKVGIITRSTKSELERLEREQDEIEIAISQGQIRRPIMSREQIEFYIMQFAKIDFSSPEQKTRLIDAFVNSVHVYDDKMVVLLNYRNGEKCVQFEELSEEMKKANTQEEGCSTLVMNVFA